MNKARILQWFAMKAIFVATPFGVAANDVGWAPEPPGTVSFNQSFQVGAQGWAPDEEEMTLTLFKNGVYLGSGTGNSPYFVVSASVSVYDTVFVATESSDPNEITEGMVSKVVNPDNTPPSVPGNLAATSQTSTSFILVWNASTDNSGSVTAYEVKQGETSLGSAAQTSRTITALTPGVSYSFSVRARDAKANWSAWSSALGVTLTDTVTPTAPSSLASPSSSSNSVNLTWIAASDDVAVVYYDVYRTRSGATIFVASVAAPSLSYVDTHVIPATNYTYAVRARDAASNASGESNPVNVTTAAQADANADEVPDSVMTLVGLAANTTLAPDSALSLKTHRPAP